MVRKNRAIKPTRSISLAVRVLEGSPVSMKCLNVHLLSESGTNGRSIS